MNRFLCAAAVLLGLASVEIIPTSALAASDAARPEAKGPVSRFEPISVDFGQVRSTEVKRSEFVVTNTGDEPLLIISVNPSCGCTTAGEWDREIAPGKSGKIAIEFNPGNFNGAVTKTITVATNERMRPTQVLELKANIWRPFQVQPAFANFLPVEGEPSAEVKVIRIVSMLEEAAELSAPQSSDPRFKAELKTVRPGKEFELHVTYDAAGSAAAPSATITVNTSLKDQPTLSVSAFAMPQPAVVVIPPTLQLPAPPLQQDYQHNIVIRSNGATPLQVSEPAVDAEGVRLKVTEAQPGKLYYINVSIPHDFKMPAEGHAVVTAKTSHPKFPEIRVPIVQERAFARPTAANRPAAHN